ncbi:MAG: ribonuclease [Bacteroidales bacterium]|nr:ribonuclease [Bacteroidales bacterium]
MNYKYFITGLALCLTFELSAAERSIPQNYYNGLDGKTTSALKTAAHNAISPHTKHSYSSLWTYFEYTDVYPGGTQWWDMYSNDIRYVSNGNTGMNKEHSFPKSWWGGTKNEAYSDLNHLYPSEIQANSAKSNHPLGEVDRTKSVNFNNGCSMVGYPVSGQGGGAKYVFEPDDRYKGDLARAYFYVVTCYQDYSWETTYMVQNGTYPTLNSWSVEMLLRWSREDPVSQKEIDRNEAVYTHQGNRNPFIDFPELAEYIWGNKMGEKFVLAEHMGGGSGTVTPEPEEEAKLISPSQNFVLEFGEVAYGQEGSAQLLIKGENLDESSSLRLAVYDNSSTDDAALFTIDGGYTQTVSTTVANTAAGLSVRIDYKPTSIGEHESRLVISRGGLTGSIGIALHGTCVEFPELTAPRALPATDITETSYTANWELVTDEEVDYFIVNRTKYIAGSAETEQIEVHDEMSYTVTDFCGSESYTVQSVRLGVYSPESQSISVMPGGITKVETDIHFGVNPHADGILITTSDVIPVLKVCDMSGRNILTATDVKDNDVIELRNGIYIVSASGVAKPIKVIVRN